MDKDRIVGSAKEIKGTVKEAVGNLVGNPKLAADGQTDKAEGELQNAVGSAKDALKQ